MGLDTISEVVPSIRAWVLVAGAVGIYICYLAVYNLFLSPLTRFPGPKLWAISYVPSQTILYMGHYHKKMLALHDQYGPIVRTGPTTLSFNTAQGFRDIYGFRQGVPQFPKDSRVYGSPMLPTRDAIGGYLDNETHSRHRRLLSHGFSDKALREQEGRIVNYIDLLMLRFRESAQRGQPVDMKTWLNCLTFDITGDLMFAEPFDSLKNSYLHPWIWHIFNGVKGIAMLAVIRHFKFLTILQEAFMPESFRQQVQKSFDLTVEKADRRLLLGKERPDFMTAILKNGFIEGNENPDNDQRLLSRHEIHSNSAFVIIAGSETTATALSGCSYYLCKNKSVLDRLCQEVRSSFQSSEEITSYRCFGLPYLNAVIEETLRVYPPVVTQVPRVTPKGGATVEGHFLPENICVAVSHYATYMSESNFTRPKEFLPERWLKEDPQFDSDNKDALQPFVVGPRNCLGKNLAYLEMRVTLAKFIFNFDIELCPECEGWDDQRTYFIWDKPSLMIRLTDRLAV